MQGGVSESDQDIDCLMVIAFGYLVENLAVKFIHMITTIICTVFEEIIS